MTHNHVAQVRHMTARAQHRAHSELDHAQRRLASLRSEAMARGGAIVDQIKDRGGDLLKVAQTRGRKAAKSSGEWISENPGRAVGLAFVAGLIVRGLLSRRED
jgi:ElaB/YqjD/DUF883 family membrane-anchored ribosome-binding protein